MSIMPALKMEGFIQYYPRKANVGNMIYLYIQSYMIKASTF